MVLISLMLVWMGKKARLTWHCNTDFNAANAVVEATHRYKEIFYDDN